MKDKQSSDQNTSGRRNPERTPDDSSPKAGAKPAESPAPKKVKALFSRLKFGAAGSGGAEFEPVPSPKRR